MGDSEEGSFYDSGESDEPSADEMDQLDLEAELEAANEMELESFMAQFRDTPTTVIAKGAAFAEHLIESRRESLEPPRRYGVPTRMGSFMLAVLATLYPNGDFLYELVTKDFHVNLDFEKLKKSDQPGFKLKDFAEIDPAYFVLTARHDYPLQKPPKVAYETLVFRLEGNQQNKDLCEKVLEPAFTRMRLGTFERAVQYHHDLLNYLRQNPSILRRPSG